MKNKKSKYKENFQTILQGFQSRIIPPDEEILSQYLYFAQILDSIENRPFYILNLFTHEFFYISKKYLLLLGYDKEKILDFNFFFDAVHPDDFKINNEAPLAFQNYISEFSINKKTEYKLVTDFRLRMPTGKYIRIVEHLMNLLYDGNGYPVLVFALCSLSPNQNITSESGAYIFHIPTGKKIMNIGNKEAVIDSNSLSKREEEILRLVALGYSSKLIADKLNISIHTVSNHRNNISRKTSSSNTFEAIKYIFGL